MELEPAAVTAIRRVGSRSGYPPGAATANLTGEQERQLLEHLPIVRFLAQRIHERLPQHVDIEDLVSVSYTHLDVYKRQIVVRRTPSAWQPNICGLPHYA